MMLDKDPVREKEPEEDRGKRVLFLSRPAVWQARRCRIREMACQGTVVIDAACIVPRKVAEKDWEVRVTMERWRAPAPAMTLVLPLRPYGDKENRTYGRPLARFMPIARDRSVEVQPALTRWRQEPGPVIEAIKQRLIAREIELKPAIEAAKAAKRWKKPLGPMGFVDPPEPPVDREVFAVVEAIKATEKLAKLHACQLLPIFGRKNQKWPVAEIERDPALRQGLVHRHQRPTIPADAALVAERFPEYLPQYNSHILDQMMRVHVEIAGRAQFQITQRMFRQQRQHVIEKR